MSTEIRDGPHPRRSASRDCGVGSAASRRRHLPSRLAITVFAALVLAACGGADEPSADGAAAATDADGAGTQTADDADHAAESTQAEVATRTVAHHLGEVDVPAERVRIVSAS